MRILVVEDDPLMASLVREVLEGECYAVDAAADGEGAAELMDVNTYDLVVLDWGIPSPSGIELLRAWRGEGKSMPVLMLTARSDVADRVDGLDNGADDYLTKPFALLELAARVRNLLRRRQAPVHLVMTAGDLRLDRAKHQVTVAGKPVVLSAKEFAIVEYLLTRKDETVTRTEIEEHSWDESSGPMANVVDVFIHRLRKKIDAGRKGSLIHTVRGVGYVLRSERS